MKFVKKTFIARLAHSAGTIKLPTRRLELRDVLVCIAVTSEQNSDGVQLIGRNQLTTTTDIMARSVLVALRSPRMQTLRGALSPTTFNLKTKRSKLLIHAIQPTTLKCVTSISTQLIMLRAKLLKLTLSKRSASVRWTVTTASVAIGRSEVR